LLFLVKSKSQQLKKLSRHLFRLCGPPEVENPPLQRKERLTQLAFLLPRQKLKRQLKAKLKLLKKLLKVILFRLCAQQEAANLLLQREEKLAQLLLKAFQQKLKENLKLLLLLLRRSLKLCLLQRLWV